MSIMAIGRILKIGGCFYYRVEKRGLVGGVVHPGQWEKVIFSQKKGWGGGLHIYLNCGTKKNRIAPGAQVTLDKY